MTLQSEISSKAADLRDDARSAVKTKAREGAEHLRDDAVERVSQVANAVDAAGAEFDYNSMQAQAADQIAQQVEGFANTLRNTDLTSVTRDVSDFARKNPALFIGGAALMGFAATRFLKARDPQPVQNRFSDVDPWASHDAVNGESDVQS